MSCENTHRAEVQHTRPRNVPALLHFLGDHVGYAGKDRANPYNPDIPDCIVICVLWHLQHGCREGGQRRRHTPASPATQPLWPPKAQSCKPVGCS